MIFRTKNKHYSGRSAIEVVRSLERDDKAYGDGGGPIRQYLHWSSITERQRAGARPRLSNSWEMSRWHSLIFFCLTNTAWVRWCLKVQAECSYNNLTTGPRLKA